MIKDVINRIKDELVKTFAELDHWPRIDSRLLDHVPIHGGWTIKQILEHVSITNHFLLILIRKGTAKAIEQSTKNNFEELIADYDLDWDKLDAIAKHRSFEWSRPEHMEPTGQPGLGEVKLKLDEQLRECLGYLGQMPNGEGVLYKTMMSVNNLGKIDVYHYIYFLVQHAKRHIEQMRKIRLEFKDIN